MLSRKKKQQMMERINASLEAIRPYLHADEGDVHLVNITDDLIVQLRFSGMCESCPMASRTVVSGLTDTIRGLYPEIAGVEVL
ncbi:MAG: NifU family protein [Chitinophagales bacterium]|nr:NifU family protein [Chitinophagales bacterium]MDW8393428.1 NifU family protein [Chitinophagales bacterium]